MTRFRSSFWVPALLLLAGCAAQSGTQVQGSPGRSLDYAYIPLEQDFFLAASDAGAVVLGGGVAVTAGHAAHMLDAGRLIGVSGDYDLAFFRTDRTASVFETGKPQLGERIVSYAHEGDRLYRAEGVVTGVDVPVQPRCERCAPAVSFVFEGNAGPGYSGGPVLDAASGKLVGIVFGYLDEADGKRAIYAYGMDRVAAELDKLQGGPRAPLPARKD